MNKIECNALVQISLLFSAFAPPRGYTRRRLGYLLSSVTLVASQAAAHVQLAPLARRVHLFGGLALGGEELAVFHARLEGVALDAVGALHALQELLEHSGAALAHRVSCFNPSPC